MPSVEIMHMDENDLYDVNVDGAEVDGDHYDLLTPGWYWQSGLPGCMPEGDLSGPYATAEQATEEAVGDCVTETYLAQLLEDAGSGYICIDWDDFCPWDRD